MIATSQVRIKYPSQKELRRFGAWCRRKHAQDDQRSSGLSKGVL
jgi:hypothetical protein